MKNFLINLWTKFFGKAENTIKELKTTVEAPVAVVICKCGCGNENCKCDANCKCVDCGCECGENCSCKQVKEVKKSPVKPKQKNKKK